VTFKLLRFGLESLVIDHSDALQRGPDSDRVFPEFLGRALLCGTLPFRCSAWHVSIHQVRRLSELARPRGCGPTNSRADLSHSTPAAPRDRPGTKLPSLAPSTRSVARPEQFSEVAKLLLLQPIKESTVVGTFAIDKQYMAEIWMLIDAQQKVVDRVIPSLAGNGFDSSFEMGNYPFEKDLKRALQTGVPFKIERIWLTSDYLRLRLCARSHLKSTDRAILLNVLW